MQPGKFVALKNLPSGYTEEQLRKYLSQFGPVKNIRICTRKGDSQIVSIVEFLDKKAAKMAAKTMNNTRFFNNILRCCLVDPQRLPDKIFDRSKQVIDLNGSFMSNQGVKMSRTSLDRSCQKTLNDHYRKIIRVEHLLTKLGIDLECHIINCNLTGD